MAASHEAQPLGWVVAVRHEKVTSRDAVRRVKDGSEDGRFSD